MCASEGKGLVGMGDCDSRGVPLSQDILPQSIAPGAL